MLNRPNYAEKGSGEIKTILYGRKDQYPPGLWTGGVNHGVVHWRLAVTVGPGSPMQPQRKNMMHRIKATSDSSLNSFYALRGPDGMERHAIPTNGRRILPTSTPRNANFSFRSNPAISTHNPAANEPTFLQRKTVRMATTTARAGLDIVSRAKGVKFFALQKINSSPHSLSGWQEMQLGDTLLTGRVDVSIRPKEIDMGELL